MGKVLLLIPLILVACGHKGSPAAVVCTPYASPYLVQGENGAFSKSEVALCSDGLYKVTSLSSGEAFSASMPIVRLLGDNGLYNVSFDYVGAQ